MSHIICANIFSKNYFHSICLRKTYPNWCSPSTARGPNLVLLGGLPHFFPIFPRYKSGEIIFGLLFLPRLTLTSKSFILTSLWPALRDEVDRSEEYRYFVFAYASFTFLDHFLMRFLSLINFISYKEQLIIFWIWLTKLVPKAVPTRTLSSYNLFDNILLKNCRNSKL